MLTNTLIISLGSAVLSILLFLGLRRNILKQPEGGKRIIDSVKIVSREVKKSIGKQNTVLFPMTAAVFVLILYFLNWQTALAFLAGALATILINRILSHIIAENSGRVVEASRKNIREGANVALKSGVVSASLILGLSLLITAGVYAIFQNTQILVGLGFGVALVSLYAKVSSAEARESTVNPNSAIALFELTVLAMIVAMVSVKFTFGNPTNPTLFVLIIASASTITFLVASFFVRFFKNTKKLSTIFYLALAVQTVLFAGSVFFAKTWLIKEIGIHYLINFYGLSILTLVLLFLAGSIILLNIYFQIIRQSASIVETGEMQEGFKNHILEIKNYSKRFQLIHNTAVVIYTAFVAVISFVGYSKSIIATHSLDLGDYLVLSGLFLGLVASLVLYKQKNSLANENIIQNILFIVIVVLVPVIIGLILGPLVLGGYMIGIILSSLFAATYFWSTFANIIRVSAIIALLISSSIVL